MVRPSLARTFTDGRIVFSAHPCSHRFAARLRLGGYAGHHERRAARQLDREELERRRHEQDARLDVDGRGALRLLRSSRFALTQPDRLRRQAHLPSASVWSRNALIAFLRESADSAEFAPVRRFLWFVEKSGLLALAFASGLSLPNGSRCPTSGGYFRHRRVGEQAREEELVDETRGNAPKIARQTCRAIGGGCTRAVGVGSPDERSEEFCEAKSQEAAPRRLRSNRAHEPRTRRSGRKAPRRRDMRCRASRTINVPRQICRVVCSRQM